MDSQTCLCGHLRRTARALTRRYDDALAPAGLTITQFTILRTLDAHGEARLAELAEATHHEKSALWRTLQPLVRQGWVVARDRLLSLTPEGRDRLAAALPHWRAVQTHVADTLGGREAALVALLSEVRDQV